MSMMIFSHATIALECFFFLLKVLYSYTCIIKEMEDMSNLYIIKEMEDLSNSYIIKEMEDLSYSYNIMDSSGIKFCRFDSLGNRDSNNRSPTI